MRLLFCETDNPKDVTVGQHSGIAAGPDGSSHGGDNTKCGPDLHRLPGQNEGPCCSRSRERHQKARARAVNVAEGVPPSRQLFHPWPPAPLVPFATCSFIRQFEDRSSGHVVDPEADSSCVQVFLTQVEQQFQQHPVWRGCQPEVLDQAVEVRRGRTQTPPARACLENKANSSHFMCPPLRPAQGLEKYVMSKVWRQTFGVWQEDRERDERYRRLMQVQQGLLRAVQLLAMA